MTFYLMVFSGAFLFSLFFTYIFKGIAPKIGAIDHPGERKIHKEPKARLGGVAIFISLFTVAFIILPIDKHLLGVFIGALILLFFGILDDVKNISPWVKLLGQTLSVLVIIASGLGIDFISNPFGGIIHLNTWKIPLDIFGTTYHITFWSDLFTLGWILLVINAVNFLDGVDGLASGVSGIAGIVLFFLSISPEVAQFNTAIFALIYSGAAFGFLPLNFHPAKIFMGDSGSMFLGFILAVLSIFSGGKIATALLLLGLPILDLLWAVIRRISKGRSPFAPDKNHFHHELLKRGLSQRKVVLILYSVSLIFGLLALRFNSFNKLIALVALLTFALALIGSLYFLKPKRLK